MQMNEEKIVEEVEQLKKKNGTDFKHGDCINVGNYIIHIRYKSGKRKFKTPASFSYVENRKTFKMLDATPGMAGGRPYYLDDFLHRTKKSK